MSGETIIYTCSNCRNKKPCSLLVDEKALAPIVCPYLHKTAIWKDGE